MSQPAGGLTCPKCRGTMRTYERNGVHVDQCGECRGVFLDHGELERLVDAETRFYDPPRSAMPVQAPYDSYRTHSGGYSDRRDGDHHGKRKRGGFLGELFD
jgi:Zn-finger nucleic acid-binding protein